MKAFLIKAIGFWMILFLPTSAISEETYKFQRLLPVLQQPWYFNMPSGIAIDRDGFVYVADTGNHQIQKFASDGQFIAKWGNKGIAFGKFDSPDDVAVDSDGFVYASDMWNFRIQKFDKNGHFVKTWNIEGTNFIPSGIDIDNFGFVYVVNAKDYSICKFTSDGNLILKWGGEKQSSQIMHHGIAIDSKGFVYVADTENNRIRKFDANGELITTAFIRHLWKINSGFPIPTVIAEKYFHESERKAIYGEVDWICLPVLRLMITMYMLQTEIMTACGNLHQTENLWKHGENSE